MDPLVVRPFFAEAVALRAEFERRVGASRTVDHSRFVWDYWHVPGQYSYLRTPARRFFPAPLYGRLLAAIRAWGASTLGCGAVSDPWLSYYVEGGRQELHTDVPQGPWAYVYSLTRDPGFSGGETVLIRDLVLDFWGGFEGGRALEHGDLVHRIRSEFDQLVVFDARVPHGVSVVAGTGDPLRSRVVVHGWFNPPAITIRGALRSAHVGEQLAMLNSLWEQIRAGCGPLDGVAVWEVSITADGSASPRPLTGTMVVTAHGVPGPDGALAKMSEELARTRFPSALGPSTLVFAVSADSR